MEQLPSTRLQEAHTLIGEKNADQTPKETSEDSLEENHGPAEEVERFLHPLWFSKHSPEIQLSAALAPPDQWKELCEGAKAVYCNKPSNHCITEHTLKPSSFLKSQE